ncbi:MAG: InlB B-repeat-containing protein [Spirochaetaceae bacterium]|nr:InlB B-repeat-containing protein [Spirochaetaceae bacterium]
MHTHNGPTNRGRFCLAALFLFIAAVFVGGCDGPHTLREYLEARSKRRKEDTPSGLVLVTATPTAAETTCIITGVTPAVTFTLTNDPPFKGGTVWRVYAAAEGDAPAPGVGVAVSGSTLTLSHPSSVPLGTYYVSATEPGRGESARAALRIAEEYPVVYHLNGGTLAGYAGSETVSATYLSDGKAVPLPAPARPGLLFIGWYGDAELSGESLRQLPAGSAGFREFWAGWLGGIYVDSPTSGPWWTYSDGMITIQDGANVILSGGPTANSVSVAPDATARLTLNNMTLGKVLVPGGWSTTFRSIDASQAAQVTVLLEGTNTSGGNQQDTIWSSALIAAPVTVIDSASSANAGSLAASSRNTEGIFIAEGYHEGAPAIQGSVTMLGGVLITQNDGYFGLTNTIGGTLTAMGGVVISPHSINSLVYPADSTAVVFTGAVPSGWDDTDHTDLVVCGSEASFSGSTITLNADLTIPGGVTLRIPAGWTLKLNGNVLTIEPGGEVVCSTNTAVFIAGLENLSEQPGNGTVTD